jgi:hypothetical protein
MRLTSERVLPGKQSRKACQDWLDYAPAMVNFAPDFCVHADNEMKRKSIKTHKDRWQQGFAALCKFRRRKGHCCPPQRHVEGKYNLGPWVITQRYLKDDLSVERKKTSRQDRFCFGTGETLLGNGALQHC